MTVGTVPVSHGNLLDKFSVFILIAWSLCGSSSGTLSSLTVSASGSTVHYHYVHMCECIYVCVCVCVCVTRVQTSLFVVASSLSIALKCMTPSHVVKPGLLQLSGCHLWENVMIPRLACLLEWTQPMLIQVRWPEPHTEYTHRSKKNFMNPRLLTLNLRFTDNFNLCCGFLINIWRSAFTLLIRPNACF